MEINLSELINILVDHFEKYQNLDRFIHSQNVVETAFALKDHYELAIDDDYIILAGLLHDYAKVLPIDEQKKYVQELVDEKVIPYRFEELQKVPLIWHSFIGPTLIHRDLAIVDEQIDDAIFYHTTGKPAMSDLTKLIFLADYIEPTRTFKEASIVREIAFRSLDEAVLSCLEYTIKHLEKSQKDLFPLTQKTYDYYHKYLGEKNVR